MNITCFRDRTQAGQLLAEALSPYANRRDVTVLGLPRGGVPVAYEVATVLNLPLDVLVVRKLGVPGWEELAMGAVASGGERVLNDRVVRLEGISERAVEQVTAQQLKELRRREKAYRGREGAPEIEGRTVILVDDGIATGATVRAAVGAVKRKKARSIIIATPTASIDAREVLAPMVDSFVALITPEDFLAVGRWYENFDQTSDAEVTRLLKASAGRSSKPEKTAKAA